MEVPDTLRQRIDSFAEGAQAWQAANEVFRVDSWVQVMLGQRVSPANWNRIGALMSEGRLKQALLELQGKTAGAVDAMPGHQAFLDSYCGG
jgi:tryptophan halogenase